jgi:hypothetical protein
MCVHHRLLRAIILTYCAGALAPIYMWAAAEDGLTIVAGTIPTLRPVLKKFFPQTSYGSYASEVTYAMNPGSPGPFQPRYIAQARTHVYYRDDQGSDKSMLGASDPEAGSHHIHKTSEVTVADYDYNHSRYFAPGQPEAK